MLHHPLDATEGHVFHVEEGTDAVEGIRTVDAVPVFARDGVKPAGVREALG